MEINLKTTANNPKNLPALFFFTDRKKFDDIFKIIESLPKDVAIIIREYDFNYQQRLEFAKKIKQISGKKNRIILIGKSLELALELGVQGVHFSDNDSSWSEYLTHIKTGSSLIFTCSCHSKFTVKKAEDFGVDAVFYSPIFKTKSHPDQEPLGIKNLKEIAKECKIPIYALGGINQDNIDLLKDTAIGGVGGISMFSSDVSFCNIRQLTNNF